jgi:hypothetical protein
VGDPVFANSMEISSKSMGGKSICQFPDVCFTPPQTPATPPGVPLPYPNTGMASDTSDGSKSVVIGGSEVMLKDRSYFKQSTGDEAGAAPKKGFVNSKTKGKVFFIAWSMDVMIESENVVRHLDMTTHNHGSNANGVVPTAHVASAAMGKFGDACSDDATKIKENCKPHTNRCPGPLSDSVTVQRESFKRIEGGPSRTQRAGNKATAAAEASPCVKAMRCFLRKYEPGENEPSCCAGQTPHHIPPQSMMNQLDGYSKAKALCVCLEGASQHVGSHGKNHAALDFVAQRKGMATGTCNVAQYNEICAIAVGAQCQCNPDCIKAQLDSSLSELLDEKVKHYQSNSKQLEADNTLKSRLKKLAKPARASNR